MSSIIETGSIPPGITFTDMTCRGGPCCNGKHHILVKNEDIPQDAKIVERNFTQRVEQERVIRMERLAQRKATSRTNKVSVDWDNPDYVCYTSGSLRHD